MMNSYKSIETMLKVMTRSPRRILDRDKDGYDDDDDDDVELWLNGFVGE